MRDLDHVVLFLLLLLVFPGERGQNGGSEGYRGSHGQHPPVRRCQNAKRATESINKFGQAKMEAFFEVIYANYEQLQPKSDSSGTGKGV